MSNSLCEKFKIYELLLKITRMNERSVIEMIYIYLIHVNHNRLNPTKLRLNDTHWGNTSFLWYTCEIYSETFIQKEVLFKRCEKIYHLALFVFDLAEVAF